AEMALRAARAMEAQRRRTSLQPHRAEESRNTERMVGVIVRDEQILDRETGAVAHHLPLRAFTAIEEQQLALALHHQRGDVAVDGGQCGARAEKRDLHHRAACTRRRNSSRVRWSSRNAPRIAEVMVLEPCFSTPRIIMQRWAASSTTPTPRGLS